MGHWAKLNDANVVTEVLVADDDAEQWLVDTFGGTWVRTSYNTFGGVHYTNGEPSDDQTKAFRYNYAGVGDTFLPDFGTDGAFVRDAPFPSWVLNPETALWEAPIAKPDDGGAYIWNESTQSWDSAPSSAT